MSRSILLLSPPVLSHSVLSHALHPHACILPTCLRFTPALALLLALTSRSLIACMLALRRAFVFRPCSRVLPGRRLLPALSRSARPSPLARALAFCSPIFSCPHRRLSHALSLLARALTASHALSRSCSRPRSCPCSLARRSRPLSRSPTLARNQAHAHPFVRPSLSPVLSRPLSPALSLALSTTLSPAIKPTLTPSSAYEVLCAHQACQVPTPRLCSHFLPALSPVTSYVYALAVFFPLLVSDSAWDLLV